MELLPVTVLGKGALSCRDKPNIYPPGAKRPTKLATNVKLADEKMSN